eukprot:2197527-Pleurochrysis_carterae.AAC.1
MIVLARRTRSGVLGRDLSRAYAHESVHRRENSGNQLGTMGIDALTVALKASTSLTKLDVGHACCPAYVLHQAEHVS